jgi:hypothetical protein
VLAESFIDLHESDAENVGAARNVFELCDARSVAAGPGPLLDCPARQGCEWEVRSTEAFACLRVVHVMADAGALHVDIQCVSATTACELGSNPACQARDRTDALFRSFAQLLFGTYMVWDAKKQQLAQNYQLGMTTRGPKPAHHSVLLSP